MPPHLIPLSLAWARKKCAGLHAPVLRVRVRVFLIPLLCGLYVSVCVRLQMKLKTASLYAQQPFTNTLDTLPYPPEKPRVAQFFKPLERFGKLLT